MKTEKIAHKIIEVIILALVVWWIVHYCTKQLEDFIGVKAENIKMEIQNIHK